MNRPLRYIDRQTQEVKVEKIYGEWALRLAYGGGPLSRPLAFLTGRISFFSRLYGWWQRRSWTKHKVPRFIHEYGLDKQEFLKQDFESFDDFFIRKLKEEARPLAAIEAVMPADGRYLVYPRMSDAEPFTVKGRRFCASELIGEDWGEGSMVWVRLCPSDYHRFHFPCSGIPGPPRLVNGPLFSVNPIAIKLNPAILCQNKRVITEIDSDDFGRVLMVEVGATNVGSIHQVYTPGKKVQKGEEKGYFSFGGSAIVLLFESQRIQFESDLLGTGLEILCFTKSALGRKKPSSI